MTIRSAKEKDLKEIRSLWHDCFSDPYEYIDFYLENRFSPKYCAVLEVDREVVGMIHLLPCTIFPDIKVLYWYAAGIRSDKRKQGLFKKFAGYVKEKANELGFQNLCVPAPGLEEYYQSMGFKFAYTSNDVEYNKTTEDEVNHSVRFENASIQDFMIHCLNEPGDTVWDEEAIRYAIEEARLCGGKVYRFHLDQKLFSFFAIKKDKAFLIDYHNMSTDVFSKVKDAIFQILNCEKLIFRTSGREKIIGLTDSDALVYNSRITMTLA